MGFHVTEQLPQANPETPLEKPRLGFFSPSRSRAGFSVSQLVATHWEKRPTPMITASGVRYYGYRYYSPSLGRWLARDPIEEQGCLNLYVCYANNPVDRVDFLGRFPIPPSMTDSRLVWLMVAAGMKVSGLPMSGELLARSILWPFDISQYAAAIGPIKNSSEYRAFVATIPNGSYPSFLSTRGITFTSDNDLYVAFRTVDVSYKGCKAGTSRKLDIRIDDNYDFHFTPITGRNITQVLATLGANAAYISQMLGDIHSFHITVTFSDP